MKRSILALLKKGCTRCLAVGEAAIKQACQARPVPGTYCQRPSKAFFQRSQS